MICSIPPVSSYAHNKTKLCFPSHLGNVNITEGIQIDRNIQQLHTENELTKVSQSKSSFTSHLTRTTLFFRDETFPYNLNI